MTRSTFERAGADWKRFVVEHGHRASAHDLAFILQRPIEEISRLRATGACSKAAGRKKLRGAVPALAWPRTGGV